MRVGVTVYSRPLSGFVHLAADHGAGYRADNDRGCLSVAVAYLRTEHAAQHAADDFALLGMGRGLAARQSGQGNYRGQARYQCGLEENSLSARRLGDISAICFADE